jgi:hypothetical protein
MNPQTHLKVTQADDALLLWSFLTFIKEGWSRLAVGLVLGDLVFFMRRSWLARREH